MKRLFPLGLLILFVICGCKDTKTESLYLASLKEDCNDLSRQLEKSFLVVKYAADRNPNTIPYYELAKRQKEKAGSFAEQLNAKTHNGAIGRETILDMYRAFRITYNRGLDSAFYFSTYPMFLPGDTVNLRLLPYTAFDTYTANPELLTYSIEKLVLRHSILLNDVCSTGGGTYCGFNLWTNFGYRLVFQSKNDTLFANVRCIRPQRYSFEIPIEIHQIAKRTSEYWADVVPLKGVVYSNEQTDHGVDLRLKPLEKGFYVLVGDAFHLQQNGTIRKEEIRIEFEIQ